MKNFSILRVLFVTLCCVGVFGIIFFIIGYVGLKIDDINIERNRRQYELEKNKEIDHGEFTFLYDQADEVVKESEYVKDEEILPIFKHKVVKKLKNNTVYNYKLSLDKDTFVTVRCKTPKKFTVDFTIETCDVLYLDNKIGTTRVDYQNYKALITIRGYQDKSLRYPLIFLDKYSGTTSDFCARIYALRDYDAYEFQYFLKDRVSTDCIDNRSVIGIHKYKDNNIPYILAYEYNMSYIYYSVDNYYEFNNQFQGLELKKKVLVEGEDWRND